MNAVVDDTWRLGEVRVMTIVRFVALYCLRVMMFRKGK